MLPIGIRLRRGRGKGSERHGMTRTSEYKTWLNIRARCYSPKDRKFSYYGGRGVTVCDEWLKSFVSFFLAMGPRPSKHHSIDRIEGAKGYVPNNCRWATREEQVANRSHVYRRGK